MTHRDDKKERIRRKKHYHRVPDAESTLDEYAPMVVVTRQRQAKINATKKTLCGHVDEANRLLREIVDLLLLRYKFTNPEFYNEYEQSRTIVD